MNSSNPHPSTHKRLHSPMQKQRIAFVSTFLPTSVTPSSLSSSSFLQRVRPRSTSSKQVVFSKPISSRPVWRATTTSKSQSSHQFDHSSSPSHSSNSQQQQQQNIGSEQQEKADLQMPGYIDHSVINNTENKNGNGNNGNDRLPSLTDGAIAVDPVKNIPPSLIDASGALQIDDGSFTPEPILPVRLVRRRDKTSNNNNITTSSMNSTAIASSSSSSKKLFKLSSVRTDLSSGFDHGILSTLALLGLFLVWYWSNAAFNVLNKQALRAFPFPLTVTVIQFFVASVIMASVWLLGLKKPPQPSVYILRTALPLAILHAAGFVLTNMSLGRVSVAFTHTVKATEPFFSVALTPSILGDVPTWGIIGSLFPIVAGVSIASATDVSFNWPGFLSAIGSNLALQSRNVLSKRLMDTSPSSSKKKKNITITTPETTTLTTSTTSSSSTPKKKRTTRLRMRPLTRFQQRQLESLDNVNLFAAMTMLAFLILAPIGVMIEGLPLLSLLPKSILLSSSTSTIAATATTTTTTASAAASILSKPALIRALVLGGVYRCIDVLASYMILKRVSPVSHSIGNCVKRAIVIVASVIFFKTKVTTLNIIGTTLALLGVLAYSLVVSACKQNSFGPDSPFCRPIYSDEEFTEGGGI